MKINSINVLVIIIFGIIVPSLMAISIYINYNTILGAIISFVIVFLILYKSFIKDILLDNQNYGEEDEEC